MLRVFLILVLLLAGTSNADLVDYVCNFGFLMIPVGWEGIGTATHRFTASFRVLHETSNPSERYPVTSITGTERIENGTVLTLSLLQEFSFAISSPWYSTAGGRLYIVSTLGNYRRVLTHLTSDGLTYVGVYGPDGPWAGPWFRTNESYTSCAPAPTAGSSVGDPQFTGFLGQSYQVHGLIDAVHNIISAPTLQVNAEFVYLESGVCPEYENAPRTNCWSHPGTYFGKIGVKTRAGDRFKLESGDAHSGFESAVVNDQPLAVGESFVGTALNVTRTSTHTLIASTDLFVITMENSDHYINLATVEPLSMAELKRQDVHGLLGQTWQRRHGSQIKAIEGFVDDYVEMSNDLFGDDTMYNRFGANSQQ